MRTPLHAPGARVTLRRGAFPMDDGLIGRAGLIVTVNAYSPVRYGVTLDGETEIREFAEDEVQRLEEPAGSGPRGATGPTVGPTPSGGSAGQH